MPHRFSSEKLRSSSCLWPDALIKSLDARLPSARRSLGPLALLSDSGFDQVIVIARAGGITIASKKIRIQL